MEVQKGWLESNQAPNPASKILNSTSSNLGTQQYEGVGKFLSYGLDSCRPHGFSLDVSTDYLCLSLANTFHIPGIPNIWESLLYLQFHLQLYTSICQKFPTWDPALPYISQTPRVSFEIWVEVFMTYYHLYSVYLKNSHLLSNSDKEMRCYP